MGWYVNVFNFLFGLMTREIACLQVIAPYFPWIFKIMGIVGWFGLTMILSLGSDLLSLFTLHLYLAYIIATGIFAGQVSVAHSLWNLFRGMYSCKLPYHLSLIGMTLFLQENAITLYDTELIPQIMMWISSSLEPFSSHWLPLPCLP